MANDFQYIRIAHKLKANKLINRIITYNKLQNFFE